MAMTDPAPEKSGREALFRAFFEQMSDGACIFERLPEGEGGLRDWRYVAMNPAMQDIFHVSDLTGQTIRENFPSETEDWYDDFDRVLETGETMHIQRHSVPLNMLLEMVVSRLDDSDGDRLLAVMKDGAPRIGAERERRRTEERYRALFDAIDEGFCVVEVLFDKDRQPADYRFLETNAAFERQTGLAKAVGKRMRALEPEHEQFWFDTYGDIALSGTPCRFEHCAKALGHWYDVYAFRIDRPERHRVAILFNDVAERKLAEQALRESEEQLRALVQGVPQLVWIAHGNGEWNWASPQWSSFTGLSNQESKGFGWLDAIHPEDREAASRLWDRARETGVLEMEWRLRSAASGRYRWFQTRAAPLRGHDGTIAEWLGTFTDIQDIKQLQGHQKLLLAELQHRVRNLLGMVRSIVRQSADRYSDLDEYVAHLVGRLEALGRTQIMLTRAAGTKIELETLVRDELDAYLAVEENVIVSGPEVRLAPKPAEILTLVLHELATNSLKYGALGNHEKLEVQWSRDMRDSKAWLHLTWRERSGRAAPGEVRRGFGTELIEDRIPYELKGEGRMRVDAEGMLAQIAFPLSEGSSILDAGAGRLDE